MCIFISIITHHYFFCHYAVSGKQAAFWVFYPKKEKLLAANMHNYTAFDIIRLKNPENDLFNNNGMIFY